MTPPRSGLGGLPQRLVQDGVVDESGMHLALHAAAEKRTSFVTQLIAAGAATARDIALAAASEYGVPLLDLNALAIDLDTVKAVSDKLLVKHRVLPLFRRGKKLFLGVADPTNLHAIDEIKFQTGLAVEAIVVEDDKLQKYLDKAIEQADTSMPSLGEEEGVDLEALEVSGGDEELGADVSRDEVEDAPIVRFVNKVMLDAIRKGAPFACACAWTACSRKWPSHRYSWRARLPRASRSCRDWTSPSGVCRRTGASRCACRRPVRSTFA